MGISKGNTQSAAFAKEAFDGVGFKGIRDRILTVMQSVGLLLGENAEQFDKRFSAKEAHLAFASVVRCSLTGWNAKKRLHTAESPCVLPAFRPGEVGHQFVQRCSERHLGNLPQRTRLVILLGNTDSYISAMMGIVGATRSEVRPLTPVGYISREVLFLHVAHPSRGNGHFANFIAGRGKSGQKRDWARRALEVFDGIDGLYRPSAI